ncbi:MAG: class I SAM-dependent DNA methyltransferase [Kiritimatiellae bacterium]|nr:class I SAM-dependent DNA methyltransferase [Kiritimatiellia bacterium]
MARYQTGANIGFEEKLWLGADKLRGSMDASEYKHIILGLIFLKYISDKFHERRECLVRETSTPGSEYHTKNEKDRLAVLEDRDEYTAKSIFWVPTSARWDIIQKDAKKPTIGQVIDNAMDLIERENRTLKGILPKNYAKPEVDKRRLGELIDLISTIDVLGHSKEQDMLGRIYEYFLSKFAAAEGKGGGEFYTPSCVVRTLVEMLQPYKGRIYDPCCGSGGMFVQSEKFAEAHGGRKTDLSVYGQESNPTTWRLARMNLAIRGIEADLGEQWADTFHRDQHPDLKADFILANPPFNISDWGGEKLKDDQRWKYGIPPAGNANYAWVQHMVHHLSPNGIAGFVLANGSMSSNSGGEGDIRKALVEADLVDCMVAMPGQLFYSTQIPVCLWFLSRNKAPKGERSRKGEVLFIDARKMGTLVDRVHRELSEEDMRKIANAYSAWKTGEGYEDVAGFCKSAKLAEIEKHGFVLTPGRYVGAEELEDDGIPFEEKMQTLSATLYEQFTESAKLEKTIKANLKGLGYAEQ